MDSIQLPPSIDDSTTEGVSHEGFAPGIESQLSGAGHDPRSFMPSTQEPEFYYEPQKFMYPPRPEPVTKPDPFSNMDRTMYIILFIAFILGFFMGKTMQPVILRHG